MSSATSTPFVDLLREQALGRDPINRNAALDLKLPLTDRSESDWRFNPEMLESLNSLDRILFEQFGKGAQVAPPFSHIHYAIEHQAILRPETVAAEHLEQSITYGELNRQANRLAEILVEQGVRPGDFVALFVRRSIPMLVGMLATLKVGAAYVPQDVKVVPEKQLRHIATVADTKVILTLSEFEHLVPSIEGHKVMAIDTLMESEATAGLDGFFNPPSRLSGDERSFLLFTSGTTGNPNGVQVTHRNLCNILLTEPGDLGIRPGMRVGQILSISFDMSAWEILGALSHGATLVIRGKEFAPVVETVDVIISTPTILSTFDVEKAKNIKVVAVAGEPCPAALADKWSSVCTFYNSCGPTETTIINTMQNYNTRENGLTIGKPTPNNTVYVLDHKLNPLPIGEVGEMWAGGDCVTAGYLHNEALTSDRYRPDPFLGNGRMMFRTRDLGRWTEDGELEHYGRTDDQVKVRGFRVELDSVSGIMEAIPECKRAVTLKLNDRDLVGFVSPAHIDTEAAQADIAKALPYYAVPAFILALDELPMTGRGKIDKRRLRAMAEAYAAQQTPA